MADDDEEDDDDDDDDDDEDDDDDDDDDDADDDDDDVQMLNRFPVSLGCAWNCLSYLEHIILAHNALKCFLVRHT